MSTEDDVKALQEAAQELFTQMKAAREEIRRTVPVGTILPFAGGGTPVPERFVLADGAVLEPADQRFDELRGILKDAFRLANDPPGTCRLPNLCGRTPIGDGQGNGLALRKRGEMVGEEAHTLVVEELASHSHPVQDGGHSHTFAQGTAGPISYGIWQPVATGEWHDGLVGRSSSNVAVGQAGEGKPHSNLQPSLVVRFIIKYG